MRKYYEEPDFKTVMFESSDVIMVSQEVKDISDDPNGNNANWETSSGWDN